MTFQRCVGSGDEESISKRIKFVANERTNGVDFLVGETIVLCGLQRPEIEEDGLRLRGTQPGVHADSRQIEVLIKKPDTEDLQSLVKMHEKLKTKELSFNLVLWMTYLTLPDISISLFQLYDCETFDDGAVRLKASYDLSCTSDVYTTFCLYGSLQILIWPVGYATRCLECSLTAISHLRVKLCRIPCFYFFVLFRHRNRLDPAYWTDEVGTTPVIPEPRSS